MTIVKIEEIKTGDCVRLKSGSPKLCVVDTRGLWVDVCWIAFGTGEPHEGSYPIEALVKCQ